MSGMFFGTQCTVNYRNALDRLRVCMNIILFILSIINAKMDANYLDLEPGNEFWNRVRVPGSCYKSLVVNLIVVITIP